ncbi:hypothetical protein K7432_002569 [Basidiobolus ranarum]|uniref:V-type proton ATPase subunit S1/VOA1 transmembrane domain-containing protein n=1 Tax=Basidiobolus ranarum TaxID=34480 RepID=A0ABR2X1A7_9FUNG
MHPSRFFKVAAILATTFLATTFAESSVECPAKVAVVLNKQQTSEYIDSPHFSLHKRMVGQDVAHSDNIEHFKSNCAAEHLDFTEVNKLKEGTSYVISGAGEALDKALEHIHNTVQDYVVVLEHQAHLQKRQEVVPSPTSTNNPGPTTNPGQNQTRAEQLRSKFWTVGLLTGLLTTVILVLILLVGICWLASIEGPTRFENVKQKRN